MVDRVTLKIVRAYRREKVHLPGIEPGSHPWQGYVIPLDHKCLWVKGSGEIYNVPRLRLKEDEKKRERRVKRCWQEERKKKVKRE